MGVVFVTVGAAGGKRQAHLADMADLSQCTHDPLLARLRYRLRKEHALPKNGKHMHIDCVYSKEPVQAPAPSCEIAGDGSLNCHGYGSLVSVTATFGMCAAGSIINKLSSQNHFEQEKKAII
jgi:tRNA threonylcarbamoyladenosine dehydratase